MAIDKQNGDVTEEVSENEAPSHYADVPEDFVEQLLFLARWDNYRLKEGCPKFFDIFKDKMEEDGMLGRIKETPLALWDGLIYGLILQPQLLHQLPLVLV